VASNVTGERNLTSPKRAGEAAGAGDRADAPVDSYLRALEEVSRRRPIKGATTDEIMAMTRGGPTPPPPPAGPAGRGARA
jgi:hypothetical protein